MNEERTVVDSAGARRVLEERAREAGFDLVGVASAEPLREGGDGRRHGLHAQAGRAIVGPQETAEKRQVRGLPGGLLLSGGPSRERGRGKGSAVRVGT